MGRIQGNQGEGPVTRKACLLPVLLATGTCLCVCLPVCLPAFWAMAVRLQPLQRSGTNIDAASTNRDLLEASRREPRDYTDALAVLRSIRVRGRTKNYDVLRAKAEPLWEFKEWLLRIGYRPDDLNKLNIIHLTGSKGKGSVASYTSSLLTGLAPDAKVGCDSQIWCQWSLTLLLCPQVGRYTSPHLVHDRERISINGEPVAEEMFAKCVL